MIRSEEAGHGELSEDDEIYDLKRRLHSALAEVRMYHEIIKGRRRLRGSASGGIIGTKDAKAPPNYDDSVQRIQHMKSLWQSIFQILYFKCGDSFDYNDIRDVIQIHKFVMKSGSLRPKMSSYAKRGYVIRTGQGAFSLTEEGKKYFGIAEFEIIIS